MYFDRKYLHWTIRDKNNYYQIRVYELGFFGFHNDFNIIYTINDFTWLNIRTHILKRLEIYYYNVFLQENLEKIMYVENFKETFKKCFNKVNKKIDQVKIDFLNT